MRLLSLCVLKCLFTSIILLERSQYCHSRGVLYHGGISKARFNFIDGGIRISQTLLQRLFPLIAQKGGLQGEEVALEEVLVTPAEELLELIVLLCERDRCNRACIGIHSQRDTGVVEQVDRVIGEGVVHVCLDVGGGTDFQVDVFRAQDVK